MTVLPCKSVTLFLEKSLIEACLEAFKSGAVVAAQDMGAAGITCSTSEMAVNGGVGIELDLDKIPVREQGMLPYEYLLSESQERMLFVAKVGREQELIDIFHRWGLQGVIAGRVIEEPIVRILFGGEIAAQIPATALADNTPIYHHDCLSEPPDYAKEAWRWSPDSLPVCDETGIDIKGKRYSWGEVLLKLLDSPSIASKNWVYRQYDHQVQNNTVLFPGKADAAVIRLRSPLAAPSDCKVGIAAVVDCNARYVYLDPYEGAKCAVAEAARNLSCVGAEPLAVTDNLNFGSPENAIGYWQLASACQGISEACQAFETPVTGGNVSLYNETLDETGRPRPIYPTPVIGMVGRIADIDKAVGQGWKKEGDLIYLLGGSGDKFIPQLGASEYLAVIHDTVAGKPPMVDFNREISVQSACRHGINQGWINSAHDCAEGGLAVALAECCISARLGADISLNGYQRRLDELLFGETTSCIIVSVDPKDKSDWETFLSQKLGQYWECLGEVGPANSHLKFSNFTGNVILKVSLHNMITVWANAIQERLVFSST